MEGETAGYELIPQPAQLLRAEPDQLRVRCKYFEGDGVVVAGGLEGSDAAGQVEGARAERQVIVSRAAVVVQVHVAQSIAVALKDDEAAICGKPGCWYDRCPGAGPVRGIASRNAPSCSALLTSRGRFSTIKVIPRRLAEGRSSRMLRRFCSTEKRASCIGALKSELEPGSSPEPKPSERFQRTAKGCNRPGADLFEWMPQREVVRRVADDSEAVAVKGAQDSVGFVDLPVSGRSGAPG